MSSPVAYLHRDVLSTLQTIAPERKEPFQGEFDWLGIKFRFDTTE
jgi:hypothetical protein